MVLVPMPFVIGAPRSGTTLLRFMLDAHPELAIPPETGFLALGHHLDAAPTSGEERRRAFFALVTSFPPDAPGWRDFGIAEDRFWAALHAIDPFSAREGLRAFYRTYAARFGKRRWGDKTPTYCLHLEAIARLLPEAHFVHVIRDGRDAALSLRRTWFSPGDDIETLAAHWHMCISTARAQAAQCAHYLEVRFEDLVRDSERVLRTICDFVELSYAPEMLQYHERAPARLAEHADRIRADGTLIISHAGRVEQQALTQQPPLASRVGVWAHTMSPDERRRFEAVAGGLLAALGYGDSVVSVPAS
jgi:Sulfotransferase family